MSYDFYVNLSTMKRPLFVHISLFLIKQLSKYPMLYYALEESLECAKNNYYSTGILTFSQLLNVFNTRTPKARHLVAHNILQVAGSGLAIWHLVADRLPSQRD